MFLVLQDKDKEQNRGIYFIYLQNNNERTIAKRYAKPTPYRPQGHYNMVGRLRPSGCSCAAIQPRR